jgi:hypothetical protein
MVRFIEELFSPLVLHEIDFVGKRGRPGNLDFFLVYGEE